MADWNGVGLPPAAQRRIDNASSSDLRSSLLSVTAAAGVESVGYTPVSEVMGSIVMSTSGAVMPSCGVYAQGYGSPFGMQMNQGAFGSGSYMGGYEPYVDVINRGWSVAIERMLIEAKAVRAHGVVGIHLTQRGFEGGSIEFMVLGTAVRSNVSGDHHGRPIFTTHLDGQDVSKLVHHGWMPVTLVVEVSLAVRHDDYATLAQQSVFAQNTELPGYSQLLHSARSGARDRLRKHLTRKSEVGAIVDSLSTRIFSNEIAAGHSDHLCEVRVVGTTVAESGRHETKMQPLSILYLRDPS
ncbi:MAG: heavy metal-binding domain-containing protein [Ferrimicrobium sp.]